MKISKNNIEVKIDIPGAIIRQHLNFGDASGLGKISCEYLSLSAGVDTTPLFQGLEDNACQCPHWGYVLNGKLSTTDTDGTVEQIFAQDMFYMKPGHNVKVNEDAELIMFSPQKEHTHVLDHMKEKVS